MGSTAAEDIVAARKLVDDVIADYDERTLSSAQPPVEQVWINERLTKRIVLPDFGDSPDLRGSLRAVGVGRCALDPEGSRCARLCC
ncbi:MAG TPA: hypothetical protein VNA12_09045 [Mycobacteriales bacterium]|nr:hypothetical protein [Mycobacteriales bacterium]